MLLLLLVSHSACVVDLGTLQILLLPIDKSLVKYRTVFPSIALLVFHCVWHHTLILFRETYQQDYELCCDVEQVYLGIFQKTAVVLHLCIYRPLKIRVRQAIHVLQLLKPYRGYNMNNNELKSKI